MASYDSPLFSGRVGNLVFFRKGGKNFVRSMPDRVKQTKATKSSAKLFGRASAVGAVLRNQLLPDLSMVSDRSIQTRLTVAIAAWLRTSGTGPLKAQAGLPFIEGFPFRKEGPSLYERWKLRLRVSNPSPGLLSIKIPDFVPADSIAAPDHTVSVVCRIASAGCLLEKPFPTGHAFTELSFNYNHDPVAAQTLSLYLPTPGETVLVTAVSLTYLVSKNDDIQETTSKRFMPAGIVSAIYL